MKNIKSIFCIALAGATLSSCNDFLTLVPLNDIVYENYWTSKGDVESVLLGAYSALERCGDFFDGRRYSLSSPNSLTAVSARCICPL